MKKSKDRDNIKERVKKWMGASSIYKQSDAFDMAILETFFFIYNELLDGVNIHDIGNDLGVFPIP